MRAVLLACMAILTVAGCKSTQPMYYHGNYPTAVYHFFKNDEITIDEQIHALEVLLEQAANSGRPVAPGIHAHLGMLYFEQGDALNGALQFESEKRLFPESSTYIDFLLANARGEK